MVDYEAIYRDSDGFLLRAGWCTMTAGAGESKRTDCPRPSYCITNLDPDLKAHQWDGYSWVLATPPAATVIYGALIATGEYTGDGETTKAITGIGGTPKYLKVQVRDTVSGNAIDVYETWTELIDDDPAGMCIVHRNGASPPHAVLKNALKSFDTDGFTVGDDGAAAHPNKSGVVYNWYVLFS